MAVIVEGSTRVSRFLPPSKAEIEKNEARCEQILECREQIKVLQGKLDVLLAEQERYRALIRLRLDSSSYWSVLSPGERVDKLYILAALESQQLPESLECFGEDAFPFNIRTDKDIFQARLRHPDFESSFHKYAKLVVPPILCDDKEIMLKVVERQPLAIRTMPDFWRDDKDILRSVLKHPNIPADTLQYFSKEVQSDAELMFQVFQHPKSEFSWIEHCSELLRDSKRFLTRVVEGFHLVQRRKRDAYIHSMYDRNQILQYACQPLRSDNEFVMTCVQQSGMNLKFAGKHLRQNEPIMKAACLNTGRAIRFCDSMAVSKSLVDHKAFAAQVLGYATPAVLQLCLEKHGHDEEFVMRSFLNENIEWSMIPQQWRSNADFVASALAIFPRDHLWAILPPQMKRNFKVACTVSKFQYVEREILVDAFESCPEILSDRQVIKDLLCNSPHVRFYDEWTRILEISDIDITSDKDIMLYAVQHDDGFWKYCSEQLRGDEDILLTVAEHSTSSLILEDIYQLEHPSFVARVIQKHPTDRDSIFRYVRLEMWQIREVAMAWLSSGGEWLDSRFHPQFIEDKEMILTVIKHHCFCFRKASDVLKKDRAFVLEALAIDARIIQEADDSIFFDDDVVLEAFSRDIRTIHFYVAGDETSFAFLVAFARRVRKRLREYKAFQHDFVASIATKSLKNTAPPGCLLPMLNQGPVMLTTYEKKIASYAGVLHEEDEISRYELVSTHLAQWGV